MKRRSNETKSAICLAQVMSTIEHNEGINGDIYNSAEFEIFDRKFYMNSDGDLFERKNDELVLISPHWVKNGIYPEYSFQSNYASVQIKAYVLSMCCLKKGVYNKYMNDKSLVINHTHNMIIDGHLVPTKKYAYNPQYLEVISNTLNTIHGIFVRDYGLADMNVPAFKVPFLLELIKEKSKDEARKIILEHL